MKFLFSLLLLALATIGFAQKDTLLPAYQRYPTLPGLQLLRTDSTRYTNEDVPKKKQVLLMLFSPDCDHCQKEAEQIVANRDGLKNTQILLVSTFPLSRLKDFGEKYGLTQMANVIITKDPYYLLLSFYEARSLPYMALYNKKQKLIQTYQGAVGIEKVLSAFEAAR